MKRPLTGLAIVYASGIWLGSVLDWPLWLLYFIVAGLLAVFVVLYRSRFSLPALLAVVLAAGALSYRQATTISSPQHIANLLGLREQNAVLRGVIISDTGRRDERESGAAAAERMRFVLDVRAVKSAGEWQPATGRLMVFVSEARPPLPLRYGEEIEFSAILRLPRPVRNPGTFDWRAWLQRRRIFYTATIRKQDFCTVVARDQGNRFAALALRVREGFERALRLGLEDEPKRAGVLAGMVIGSRSEIPPVTYADFQRTGVFHVFAISGLHVGLVTAVVVGALRLLRLPQRWCGIVAIPLLVLYVFATGARPGAVRALVMACVWLIGWALVRPVDLPNALAAAALGILVWDPTQLFDGGFVLSFSVVIAIVVLAPRIHGLLWRRVRRDELLPRQLAPRWRSLTEKPALWMLQLLSCSVASWIGLLPLMAVYFNLFTPVSILANVLVIPLLGFIIALGLLAAVAYPLWPWLTLTLNNANFFLLGVMIQTVEWLGQVPWGYRFVQTPPGWAVWMYYGAWILVLAPALRRVRGRLAALVAAPAAAAAIVLTASRDQSVEITVLDLTDGASIFLNVPGEGDDWLIDGGGDWSGERVVTPFLRAQGVDRLGVVAVSRADKAHVAGLCALTGEIPVARAVHGGAGSRSKFYAQWLAQVRERGIALQQMRAGDEMRAGGAVRVRALHPQRGALASRSDDNVLVLLVEFGSTRVLLMSDAGETVERQLLAQNPGLRAHVIVKGEHGKEVSCTPEFLDAVRPEVVVQVVGTRPSGRYPSPTLRERLAARGIRLLRTDETGAVRLRLSRDGYTIRSCLAAQ
jgi:competence protein ComEC